MRSVSVKSDVARHSMPASWVAQIDSARGFSGEKSDVRTGWRIEPRDLGTDKAEDRPDLTAGLKRVEPE